MIFVFVKIQYQLHFSNFWGYLKTWKRSYYNAKIILQKTNCDGDVHGKNLANSLTERQVSIQKETSTSCIFHRLCTIKQQFLALHIIEKHSVVLERNIAPEGPNGQNPNSDFVTEKRNLGD